MDTQVVELEHIAEQLEALRQVDPGEYTECVEEVKRYLGRVFVGWLLPTSPDDNSIGTPPSAA